MAKEGEGFLQKVAFTGSGTVQTKSFKPQHGVSNLAFFVRATQAGAAVVQRLDSDGTWHNQLAPSAIAANTEQVHQITYPTNELRIEFTDMSASDGILTVEVEEAEIR